MLWNEVENISDEINVELKDFHPIIRKILFNRGIRNSKAAKDFLNPSLKNLEDPFSFYDMNAACEKIEEAVLSGKRIFIHGDFDVDGISATTILWEYLFKDMGARALPYIPSRIDEGYGISRDSLENIISKGGELIISVDCGIRDTELIEEYKKSKDNPKGLDFIITDHHEFGEKIPKNVPIIHPLHPKGENKSKYISGAAVAWKLVCALEKRRNPNFKWERVRGLDLVGLATVCDVMPLVDENRIFVKFALEQIRSNPRLGLAQLMTTAGINYAEIDSYHFGYVIGPRINAAGRIADATDAVRLFATEKESVAKTLARKLSDLNKQRQELTDTLLEKAREAIETDGTGKHLYFAYGDDWPEGIIGLVAGKLQEEFNHPVVIVSNGKKEARGSARSIKGFSIIKAIEKYADLLERYGGHDQAAGFTVKEGQIEEFKNKLQEFAHKQLQEENFVKEVTVDAVVGVEELDWEYYQASKLLEPFGYGNRKPVFWIKNAVVAGAQGLSDGKHLKIVLKNEQGGFLNCIYFNSGDWLGKILPGDRIDLVGNLDVNAWNGEETLQFKVIDLRLS